MFFERLVWSGLKGRKTTTMVEFVRLTIEQRDDGRWYPVAGEVVSAPMTKWAKAWETRLSSLPGDCWGYLDVAEGCPLGDKIVQQMRNIG